MADLIARIYTCKNERGYEDGVIRSIDNRGRFVEALEERPSSHCSRETTAPLEESNGADHYHTNKKKKDLQYEPSIQLNFSDRPKGEMGLCLGVIHRHATLILRDQSTRGTMVTYDEMDDKPRQGMTWILSGNPVPDSTDCIVIQINKLLKFQRTPNTCTRSTVTPTASGHASRNDLRCLPSTKGKMQQAKAMCCVLVQMSRVHLWEH
ncbi:serine/threonine protein kinase [Venturia nashicola]|uniref:Serine/threonine protein kinase n=1 Tax=Venturia nashicola TaxID=86259 RepID=A0A4Z1P9I6_9PEZI|nr:serine/threonine protein kinase [Venturia nashicola]